MTTIEQLNANRISFDTAIPQTVWDQIFELTGENPYGQIVMKYDEGDGIFGSLCAVTEQGDKLLKQYLEDA